MFFTPNIKGLEKLKEALWDTFNGKDFHRNQTESTTQQMSIFTEADEKDWMIELHSATAKESLVEYFSGKGEIEYVTIESFIIENTMLNGNQILEHVLKPLIQGGKVKKMGYVSRSSNYKKDKYIVGAANGN